MEAFQYRNNRLYCEDVAVAELAREVKTPAYVYSQTAMESRFRTFDAAFSPRPHLTCYAVKANSNLAVLNLFRKLGAGFDIVSGGELLRVLKAGAHPRTIVFSGVGKTLDEIDLGLGHGILQFNVESAAELRILEARARTLGKRAPVALRLNPDVDSLTHPYISTGTSSHKFGIPAADAPGLCRRMKRSRHLEITGIGFHIGSQITCMEPFVNALRRLKEVFLELCAAGVGLQHLDLGGGLGIRYDNEAPPLPEQYAKALLEMTEGMECKILLEPGRVLVGNAGILLTTVVLVKKNGEKNFVVVDAGMNDLIRPSLYGSYHGIRPAVRNRGKVWKADVVGPICESGDFFARDREIPAVKAGDILAIMSTGAYGSVFSSNYNTRPKIPEVLVRGNRMRVIRKRESFKDMVRLEIRTPL